jgi:HPr kinase/phosphorylase
LPSGEGDPLPRRWRAAGLRVLLWAGVDGPSARSTRACAEAGIAVARTPTKATQLVRSLRTALLAHTAPRATIYGVFVRVFGLGVFISGPAGIGKSELALELLSRGHTLVADDAVELLRLPGDLLLGCAPALLRGFLEVRGLGILDVHRMYGEESLCERARVDFVLHLVPVQDAPVDYRARLSGLRGTRELLGLVIPEVSLPVRVGHNLATLVEAACRDQWLRLQGVEADLAFAARHQQAIDSSKDGA